MGRRTDELTEFAKPTADELADRYGSLKRVLSAGVLALAALSSEEREYYMAAAGGKIIERNNDGAGAYKPISQADLRQFLEEVRNIVEHKARPANRSKPKQTR